MARYFEDESGNVMRGKEDPEPMGTVAISPLDDGSITVSLGNIGMRHSKPANMHAFYFPGGSAITHGLRTVLSLSNFRSTQIDGFPGFAYEDEEGNEHTLIVVDRSLLEEARADK